MRDSKTGQEIRLGDDHGHATLEAMTDQYVIWRFRRNDGRKEAISLKSGLYAHVLETGQEIVIAQEPSQQGDIKAEGQWVIYLDISGSKAYFAKLRAHNLTTGEDLLVGQEVPFNRPGEYYAISGSRIAWISGDVSGTDAKWLFRIYDLTTRTARTLNVPDTVMPSDLSFSGDIVVWWDRFWRGYDMKQDALFTIPTIPSGWENVPTQPANTVTVANDRLYWGLKVKDKVYNLTAPIIRNK